MNQKVQMVKTKKHDLYTLSQPNFVFIFKMNWKKRMNMPMLFKDKNNCKIEIINIVIKALDKQIT